MPKPTCDREYFGLPAPAEFASRGVLGSVLSRFIAGEKAIDEYCRELAHAGVAARYQHATDLRNDPVAFEAWKREPLVLGLARPPKDKEGICRALFQATFLNPSTASKRWKRVEPLWTKREPVSKVIALLNKHGLQPPPRTMPVPDDGQPDLEEGSHTTEGTDGGQGNDNPPHSEGDDVPNAVRILNLPKELISDKHVGQFVVLSGFIDSKDGNCVTLRGVIGG